MAKNHDRSAEYQPNEVPTSITRKLFVGYGIGQYNAGNIVISDYEHDSKDFATVRLLEKDVTFKLPKCKVDVKKRMLEVLEEEKQKEIANHHMKLKDIQERINDLLCIEDHSSRDSGENDVR